MSLKTDEYTKDDKPILLCMNFRLLLKTVLTNRKKSTSVLKKYVQESGDNVNG
jgi:hypothetical protein